MKTNKSIYAIAAVAALTLSSCSGFLDTPTDTRVDLVNTDQVRMLMNAAYPEINYAWVCEISSDNIEDNNSPIGEGGQGIHYNLSAYDRGDDEMFRWETCVSNTAQDSPSQIWESFYHSIAICNAAIERLDQWKAENGSLDATQKAIYGEALTLRAYNHFILAQVFCEPYRGSNSKNYLGLPYITKPETTVKPHYDRGTLDVTYANIERDMVEGIKLIDNTLYDVPKYHFNTSAAHAFAARFYLYTRRYQKAIDEADLAFGGKDADPSTYLSTLWAHLDDFYWMTDIGDFQDGISNASNFLLYPTVSGLCNRLASGYRYALVRDALNSTVYGSSPAWSNFQWENSSGKDKTTFVMHPCFNGMALSNGQREYGVCMYANTTQQFEYTDKIAGVGYVRQTRREFYGEETLLTRAEAKLFMGDTNGFLKDLDIWEKNRRNTPNAIGYENKFNDYTIENLTAFYGGGKAGYGICKTINIDRICPDTDAAVSADAIMPLLQAIQHIRRVETVHNGMRFFDIKRFGIEFDRKIGTSKAPYYVMDHLAVEDPRKAIALPAEVVAAGMQPNPRPETTGKIVDTSENRLIIQ